MDIGSHRVTGFSPVIIKIGFKSFNTLGVFVNIFDNLYAMNDFSFATNSCGYKDYFFKFLVFLYLDII